MAGPPGVVFEGEPFLSYDIQHTSPSVAADTPGPGLPRSQSPQQMPQGGPMTWATSPLIQRCPHQYAENHFG